jgi:glycosyltransferase involved in cell wall biosynthesis
MTISSFPVVCTSITTERLPHARVLARSVARHHASEQLIALIVDGEIREGDDEPFDVVYPDALSLPMDAFHELALCLKSDDLAASLVPALLKALRARFEDRSVVYLDAETALFSPLDELGTLAEEHDVVVVPRVLSAIPSDGYDPDEIELTQLGTFDSGCVAVGQGAQVFLSWWEHSLLSAANLDGARLAIAQTFLDDVPRLFGAHVLSDPGYAIASWNAHERALHLGEDGTYRVGEARLRTLHLKGFDPEKPSLISSEVGDHPRVLLSEHLELAALCAKYAQELIECGSRSLRGEPRFVRFSDGTLVDDRMRRLVRRDRAKRASTMRDSIPDPFAADRLAEFYAWLASPDVEDIVAPMLPRYFLEVYKDRSDLQWHFPRVGTADAKQFRLWVGSHGLFEENVCLGLQRAIEESHWWSAPTGARIAPPDHLHPGVAFAGHLLSATGVGEAGRLVLDALVRAGIEVRAIATESAAPYGDLGVRDEQGVADRTTNIVWINADQLPGFASVIGPEFFEGRYTVGGWVWETEKLPASMATSAQLVDEIWVPSDYVRAAIEPVVDRDVYVFPHPVVEPPHAGSFERSRYEIPEGFMFLFMFDFLSSFERKNPLAVISAFEKAFAPGSGPILILKSVHGDKHLGDLERLRLASAERNDVFVVDGRFDAASRGALLASCDCYVSLHRSEGFGLVLAEAMALEKPVIATGYSGNLQFMDEETAFLVPARMTRVGPNVAPYEEDGLWADPDVDAAAAHMRRVYERPELARHTAELARRRVLEGFGMDRAVRFVTDRMKEIESIRSNGYVSGVAEAARARL